MHSTAVRAQDDDRLTVLIDEGSVEDVIGAVDVGVTSSSYSVIEAERFRYSFVSLPDVIEQEVGVQVRSSGGEGGFSTVVLRGASSEQVIIYLDGVPLNDASGGAVDLSFIPLDNVERIEVYRGSTPLELGDPSIGGAVNIITRQSDKFSQQGFSDSQLKVTVASFQTRKVSASSSLQLDKNHFYAGVSYLQSESDFSYNNDNGTPDNPDDDRTEKRNNDGVEHLTALFNWKRRLDADLDTELRLDVSDRNKELPAVSNSAEVQTFVDTRKYSLLGQLNSRNVFADDINFNLKFFASEKDEVFDDSLAQMGFFNQRTESITRKLGSQLYAEIKQPQQYWKFLTGISRETYDTESSLDVVQSDTNRRDKFELSAESVSYFDQQRLIVNLVLRYQSLVDDIAVTTDEFASVVPGFEKTYQFVNPQLGLKYRFDNRTYITANIGQYNRAPSFVELFGGGGLLLGNADLKQEQSLNSDLGYTYTFFKPYHWLHDAEFYGGVFYNRIEDLIVRIYNGQGIGVPENIADAEVRGLEASLKLIPSARHNISANLSLIDSVNHSDIAAFDNRKLPGYYQHNLVLRYSYTLSRWSYRFEVDIKRRVFYDRANLLEGDDVNLLNAGIRYSLKNSSLDLRANNLLDENIQYFRNRPTPGLNVSVTYNLSF